MIYYFPLCESGMYSGGTERLLIGLSAGDYVMAFLGVFFGSEFLSLSFITAYRLM
jgi:hypothetical protein